MSLFYRQYLLDNHQLFLFINLIKHGIPSGNVQPVDNYPAFQYQFLFIPLASRDTGLLQAASGQF